MATPVLLTPKGLTDPWKFVWLSATKVIAINAVMNSGFTGYTFKIWVSNDAGVTYTEVPGSAIVVNNPGAVPRYCGITSDSAGNIYFSVDGGTGSTFKIIKFTKGSGDTWTAAGYDWTGITIGSKNNNRPTDPQLAIDNAGNLVIAFIANMLPDYNFQFPFVAYAPVSNLSAQVTPADPYLYNSTNYASAIALTIRNGDALLFYTYNDGSTYKLLRGTISGTTINTTETDSFFTATEHEYMNKLVAVPVNTSDVLITAAVSRRSKSSSAYATDQKILYTTWNGTSYSTKTALVTKTGTAADRQYISGPYLSTDLTSALVAYATSNDGTTWQLSSSRFNSGSFASAVNHALIQNAGLATDSPQYLVGPINQRIYSHGYLTYYRTDGTSGPYYQQVDNYYAPTQPSGLDPSAGEILDTITPTLDWNFNSDSYGDDQTAYQVVVIRLSDSVTIYDSGKITSTATQHTIPGSTLSYGVNYQWKVRTYGQSDLVSSYSSLAVFKASLKPTVSIDSPANGGTVTGGAPAVSWTYNDSEATTQSAYLLELLNAAGTSILYTTGIVASAVSSVNLPSGFLFNGISYQVRVTVYDGDGLASDPDTNAFTASFSSPASPTVTGSADDRGIVSLNISLNEPATDAWQADLINIYRKKNFSSDYILLKANMAVSSLVLDDANATTGWSNSGVATAVATDDAKVGLNSLGLGASASGTASYSKTVDYDTIANYNRAEIWLFAADKTKFTSIRIKFGQDASNYYYFDVPASSFTNGSWIMGYSDFSALSVVGAPTQLSVDHISIQIIGATAAITAGDIRFDQFRLIDSNYTYDDYTAPTDADYIYAATAYNTEQSLESAKGDSSAISVAFSETRLNTYLVPIGAETDMVAAWMDGTKVPNWSDRTETKYYQPKGSSKPVAIVHGQQKYKEGSAELRFFDALFGGQGLEGIDALEAIKNNKPILLKTWWGRNYYISIDGDIDVQRKAGIGWIANFTFTEINP